MKNRLFEAEQSKLVTNYASLGRLDVLEKSMREYEDSATSLIASHSGAGPKDAAAARVREAEQKLQSLRKMLHIQHSALALTRDDFRRVSTEKRKMNESLESTRKELEVARAEVAEVKARRARQQVSGGAGSSARSAASSGGVRFHIYGDEGVDEEDDLDLADVGSFSSMAKTKRSKSSSQTSRKERGRPPAAAAVVTADFAHATLPAPPSFRGDGNAGRTTLAESSKQVMRKDVPSWGRGFGSGSGKAWTNPTPFKNQNGTFVKGGYDGMGGMHSVLTLPPKRRGTKRSFAAAALAQSQGRGQRPTTKKKASLDTWFTKR
jgi:hypothetical protein